jgi:F420-dependent oxidoreductase-like protein
MSRYSPYVSAGLKRRDILGMLKFGVFLPFYAFQENQKATQFNHILDIVLESERLGYHSVWLDDHLMFGKTSILESWTTLSALASLTKKIKLGTMVTSNAFRNPALLAKMAATVDVISGGRLELGIGAGVQKEEHEAYGFPFPKPSIRIDRLKESVEIIKKMWCQEKANYRGKNYSVTDAVCEPKPVQKPHPPIIIGGCGEKHLLKVTAEHADRFDFGYVSTIELYKHKLQILEKHCKTVGRKFVEIEKSCWLAGQILLSQNSGELEKKVNRFKPKDMSKTDFEKFSLIGSPDACRLKMKPYLDLGVEHFMLFFGDLPEKSSLRLFAEEFGNRI